MDEGAVDLRPYFRALWRKKILIGLFGLLCAIALVALTYTMKPIWRAKAVLLLPVPSGADASLSIPLLGSNFDPLAILTGVIQSYPSQKYIADKTNLSIPEVAGTVQVMTDTSKQQLSISVDDPDQEFGIRAVQSSLDILTDLSARTDFTMASGQARELQKAVDAQATLVAQSEDALQKFQENSVTAPDPSTPFSGTAYLARLRQIEMELGSVDRQIEVRKSETKRIAGSTTDVPTALTANQKWRDKLIALEYDLRLKETQLGPDAPEVVAVKRQIEVTKGQLQQEIANEMQSVEANLDADLAKLVAQRLLLDWQRGYLVKMTNLAPKEAIEMQRLLREVAIRAEVLKDIRTRFEQQKLKSEVETIKWSVLAEPYIEPKPTNKQFLRNGLLGGLLGIMIASVFTIRRMIGRNEIGWPQDAGR